jgi:DNA mismatch repair ATPase MutL
MLLGHGISRKDLDFLGEWNYTSKQRIKQSQHQSHPQLSFYGFKGNTIASLKEISKSVEIISKINETTSAYAKLMSGSGGSSAVSHSSSEIQKIPSFSDVGTIITVKELFCNLAVRKKSLSFLSEIIKIKEFLSKISLLHHSVDFRLIDVRQQSALLHLPSRTSVLSRAVSLFGQDFVSKMIEINFQEPSCSSFSLRGFLSPPSAEYCHWNKKIQCCYYNHRWNKENKDLVSSLLNCLYSRFLSNKETQTFNTKHAYLGQASSFGKAAGSANKFPFIILQLSFPEDSDEVDFSFEPSSEVGGGGIIPIFKNKRKMEFFLLKMLKEAFSSGFPEFVLALSNLYYLRDDEDNLIKKAVVPPSHRFSSFGTTGKVGKLFSNSFLDYRASKRMGGDDDLLDEDYRERKNHFSSTIFNYAFLPSVSQYHSNDSQTAGQPDDVTLISEIGVSLERRKKRKRKGSHESSTPSAAYSSFFFEKKEGDDYRSSSSPLIIRTPLLARKDESSVVDNALLYSCPSAPEKKLSSSSSNYYSSAFAPSARLFSSFDDDFDKHRFEVSIGDENDKREVYKDIRGDSPDSVKQLMNECEKMDRPSIAFKTTEVADQREHESPLNQTADDCTFTITALPSDSTRKSNLADYFVSSSDAVNIGCNDDTSSSSFALSHPSLNPVTSSRVIQHQPLVNSTVQTMRSELGNGLRDKVIDDPHLSGFPSSSTPSGRQSPTACLAMDQTIDDSVVIDKSFLLSLSVINQWDNKFILAYSSSSKALLAFDQHGVDERINYEKLLSIYDSDSLETTSKFSLRKYYFSEPFPQLKLIEIDPFIVQNKRYLFNKWGFDYSLSSVSPSASASSSFGCATTASVAAVILSLQSVPVIVDEPLTCDDFLEFLYYVSNNLSFPEHCLKPPAVQRIIAFKACRSSIKFGTPLSIEQCDELIKKLAETKDPFHCAHGRPVLTPLVNLQLFTPK